MSKRRATRLVTIVIAVVIVAGYVIYHGLNAATSNVGVSRLAPSNEALWVKDLTLRSDIVAIGRAIARGSTFNAGSLQGEGTASYMRAQVYYVVVEKYVKGRGPRRIAVWQIEGFGEPSADDDMQEAARKNPYLFIRTDGTEYVFFLNRSMIEVDATVDGPVAVFTPSNSIWRFVVTSDRMVIWDGPTGFQESGVLIPSISLDDLLREASTVIDIDGVS